MDIHSTGRATPAKQHVSSDLLGAVAHALAGPLISARAGLDALASAHPEIDGHEVRTAVARAGVVLDGVVRLQGALRAPLVEPVELDHTLRVALRRAACVRPPPEVVAGALGTVQADADLCALLLSELLDNVAVHVGAHARVHVRSERMDGGRRLVVADSGPGLPVMVARRAPRPFAQTAGGGAGCGLAIVAGVMDGLGGTLELADTPGGGTTVRMLFPGAGG